MKRFGLPRHLEAGWRDTLLLLREFQRPLSFFSVAVLGGGLLYYSLASRSSEPPNGLAEAIYLTLNLTLLQAWDEFPPEWYLQIFYFVMPLLGLAILAQGLADFGVALFNRRQRSKEWEMAVASTYSNHIVLVGLGHLGFRVVLNLHEMDQELVVIERTPDHDLKSAVQELEIPVIEGDGRQESVLESAGVVHARAILLCTQNDSLNLQMAVKARGMNDQIRVITRIFDDDFAQALQKQFGFHALSATGMAAPAFASAAAGVDITRPLTVEGEALSLARFNLEQANGLVGLTVSSVEARFDVSVVLLRRDGHSDFHPSGLEDLRSGDVIAVLGGPNQLSGLVHGFNLKPA